MQRRPTNATSGSPAGRGRRDLKEPARRNGGGGIVPSSSDLAKYGYDPNAAPTFRSAQWRKSVTPAQADSQANPQPTTTINYRPSFKLNINPPKRPEKSQRRVSAVGRDRPDSRDGQHQVRRPLQPTSKPITEATFASPFTPNDFVSSITKGSPDYSTPALVQLFQKTLKDLDAVADRLHKTIERTTGGASIAEQAHKRIGGELVKTFSIVYAKFEALENISDEIGSTSFHVGEELQRAERQRKNAQNAKMIIELLKEFQEKTRMRFPSSETGLDTLPRRKTRHRRPAPVLGATQAGGSAPANGSPAASLDHLPITKVSSAEGLNESVGSEPGMTPPSVYDSRNGSTSLEKMEPVTTFTSRISLDSFNESLQGKNTLAVILRRLSAIIKEIQALNYDTARAGVEKYCEQFETQLLTEFQNAYEKSDYERMADAAQVLVTFNGGQSVVNSYINQHDFFMGGAALAMSESGSLARGKSATYSGPPSDSSDPRERAMDADPTLLALYKKILDVVQQEWARVSKVFTNTTTVLQVLIERIFAQSVQQLLESILMKARSHSSQSYLRSLYSSHVATVVLVTDMQDFFENSIAQQKEELGTQAHANGHTQAGATPNEAETSSNKALNHVVSRCLEDLFVPYLENEKYVRDEQECLSKLVTAALRETLEGIESFRKQLTMKKAEDARSRGNKIFGKAMERLKAVNAVRQIKDGSVQGSAASVNVPKDSEQTSAAEIQESLRLTSWKAVKLDKEIAAKILQLHGEAQNRCNELSDPLALVGNVVTLWSSLLDQVLKRYTFEALDTMLQYWRNRDFALEGKAENPASVFSSASEKSQENDVGRHAFLSDVDRSLEEVSVAYGIAEVVQYHFEHAVLPTMSGTTSISGHQEVSQLVLKHFEELEKRISDLVSRVIDVSVNLTEALLSKQGKNDYKLTEDELESAIGLMNTETCKKVLQFFEHVARTITDSLEGPNQERVLYEFGVGVCNALLSHYKHYVISLTGSMILSRDLAKYCETIQQLIPSVKEKIELLRELLNLFVVRPENLGTILEESVYLGKMEPAFIQPYLLCRADYHSISMPSGL